MGQLLQLPTQTTAERWITRRQLELGIGYCTRMVRTFESRGMPHRKLRGKNLYQLAECLEWITVNHSKGEQS